MTVNIASKDIAGALKVTVPDAKFSTAQKQKKALVSGFYWIQRTTATGNKREPELAFFHRAEEGHSFYLGKWQIFDKLTPVYHHFDRVTVFSKVETPIVE